MDEKDKRERLPFCEKDEKRLSIRRLNKFS